MRLPRSLSSLFDRYAPRDFDLIAAVDDLRELIQPEVRKLYAPLSDYDPEQGVITLHWALFEEYKPVEKPYLSVTYPEIAISQGDKALVSGVFKVDNIEGGEIMLREI